MNYNLSIDQWKTDVDDIVKSNDYHVYMIKCKTKNHYYVGISQNPTNRIKSHKANTGSAFTKKYGFDSYRIVKACNTKKLATEIEASITYTLSRLPKHVVAGAGWCQTK